MAKLALFGGEKAVTKPASAYAAPIVAPEAYAKVESLLRAGNISLAPEVGQFEKKFAEYVGASYAIAATNGTATLHMAMVAAGVGPGDEVIVPSFTYWATVAPLASLGAVPVFADVELSTHLMTAETIAAKITPKTKAIVLVHTWGTPCDMDPILALAKRHNIPVIEDASHAHGATYKGKKAGAIADIGCYSLQGSKLLPAGEGGVFVTNNRAYYERALAVGHYERLGGLPEDSPYRQYALTGFGFKYRPNPMAMVLADTALDHLDEWNEKRDRLGRLLDERLAEFACIEPQKVPAGSERVYAYHYMRYLPEKLGGLSLGSFLKALSAEGVACGVCGYGRLHQAPLFNGENPFGHGAYRCGQPLPVTELLAKTAFFAAPRFETATEEDVLEYAAAYQKVIENAELLLEAEQGREVIIEAASGRSINLV